MTRRSPGVCNQQQWRVAYGLLHRAAESSANSGEALELGVLEGQSEIVIDDDEKAQSKHTWAFGPRFRSGSFGWRSEPAITRIKEAVSEIRAVSRQEPVLAAERAGPLSAKAITALQSIDSSSGAIGATAVNRAIVPWFPSLPRHRPTEKCGASGWSSFPPGACRRSGSLH